MSAIILSSQYMPSIAWMACIVNSEASIIDINEHYQKLSLRNKCEIASPNGILKLSIPLKDGRNQRKKVKDILIQNEFKWQTLHLKSLQSCYRRSPYFEYFEPKLEQFFTQSFEKLVELNSACISLFLDILQLEITPDFSSSFKNEPENDKRNITNKGQKDITHFNFETYIQVFDDRMPFISNLSFLDLLFCLGPKNAKDYLSTINNP